MRPLGLSDTIFYNLRDSQITAVAALDGPCDLALLIAELDRVVATVPRFAETPVRIGFWWFAKPSSNLDVAAHVAVIRDPAIRRPEDLAPPLDRLRRSRLRMKGPPWRVLVLNPAGPGWQDGSLSAIFFQFRHGLADGTRGIQALARMARSEPTLDHFARAANIATIDLAALHTDIRVHDVGLSLARIPRRAISREVDASTALAEAAAGAVEDDTLFPHARPLRGNVGRTRFIVRRGAPPGVGNHLKLETIARRPVSGRKRLRIPGLARAQELPISQWAVALAPPPLARLIMRVWYASFDAIATLLPIPRRFRLGGRKVTAFFAVPPLAGPVPLVMVAMADGDHYHVSLFPGRGFIADRDALSRKVRLLLNRGMEATAATPAE